MSIKSNPKDREDALKVINGCNIDYIDLDLTSEQSMILEQVTSKLKNKNLYKEIIQTGGAIITEYPLGSKPIKNHFPARNRIISGLSEGILVIEARKKSGTLITVEHALDQGKDVYAVPRKYIEW